MEVRFEGALDIQIDIGEEVAETLIPPLSLQLLVENAIKHNLLSEEQPLKVEISFLKNDYIQLKNNCIQKDYYIQIDNKLIENPVKNTTMIGLNNIRQRYKYYTDREIFIQRSKDFIVKLPVLNGINEKKNILT
jgi:LytS/YehU family sensor histidine kinase